MRCRGWRTVAVLALLLGAGRAHAADPAPDPSARVATFLDAAADAAKAKRWQGCVDALKEALALQDAPRTRGELGLCEEGAGHLTEAYASLKLSLDLATPDKLATPPWLRFRAGLARVTARTSLVTVTADPPDARLLLDGRPIGKADGRAFAVMPGEHRFVARRAGYQDATQTLTVPGVLTGVHFFMRAIPPADAAPVLTAATVAPVPTVVTAATVIAPSAASPLPSALWYAPLVPTDSARGAGLVVAYASGLLALTFAGLALGLEVDRANRARGHDPYTCAAPDASSLFCTELHERREQRNRLGGVAIGFGALAIGAGLAVVLADVLGGRSRSVAPFMGKDGGGLVVGGAW